MAAALRFPLLHRVFRRALASQAETVSEVSSTVSQPSLASAALKEPELFPASSPVSSGAPLLSPPVLQQQQQQQVPVQATQQPSQKKAPRQPRQPRQQQTQQQQQQQMRQPQNQQPSAFRSTRPPQGDADYESAIIARPAPHPPSEHLPADIAGLLNCQPVPVEQPAKRPTRPLMLSDGTMLIIDAMQHTWRFTLDHSQEPRRLAHALRNVTTIQEVGDGFVVASNRESRLERVGSVAWKREDLFKPSATAVCGSGLLVVVYDPFPMRKVLWLSLETGETLGYFAQGTVHIPTVLAKGPTGTIAVADARPKRILLFDKDGLQKSVMRIPFASHGVGLAVDANDRVYFTDRHYKAVFVFDGLMGAHIATIETPFFPQGLVCTPAGSLIVAHHTPNGISILKP